jgi:hypothetical protein
MKNAHQGVDWPILAIWSDFEIAGFLPLYGMFLLRVAGCEVYRFTIYRL